jgi:hypothetical protein
MTGEKGAWSASQTGPLHFFWLSKLLNQESAWAHPSHAAGFMRRFRDEYLTVTFLCSE